MRVDQPQVFMPKDLMQRLQQAADSGMSDAEVLSVLWSLTPRPFRTPRYWGEILNELFDVPAEIAIRASTVDKPTVHFRANTLQMAEALWPWVHRALRGARDVVTVARIPADARRDLERLRAEIDARPITVVPRSRERFERAVREAYRVAGHGPVPVLWFDGVGSATMFINMCAGESHVRKRLIERLPCTGAEPGTDMHLLKQAFEGLRSVLPGLDEDECIRRVSRRRIGPSIMHRMEMKLFRAVLDRRDPVRSRRLAHAVISELIDTLGTSRIDTTGTRGIIIGGLQESLNSLAGMGDSAMDASLFNGFFLDSWQRHAAMARAMRIAGMDAAPALASLQDTAIELVESGYWFYPGEKLCIACDGTTAMHVEDGAVHCVDGPAVEFADGFKSYAIEGFAVPSFVVEQRERIDLGRIRRERSAEVRRIMIDRYGRGRYLNQTGATVIDMDMVDVVAGDPSFGSMPRALMRDKDRSAWLVGTDGSTKRVYYMRVPETVKSCAEAHRRLARMDESRIIASS